MLFRVFCLFFMFAAHAYAEVSIQAPDKAPAGSEIQISIAGSESAKDFVTIVSPETKAGKYDKFKYLRASPVTLSVPEDAGTFEIRVLSGESGYATLVTKEIVVTAVTASVSAPSEVKAGAIFEVSWEGPANSQDFVTIVPKGAKEGSYEQFKYPSRGGRTKVLEFVAPEEAGEYEMRYVTASKRYTLASTPISVISVEASVSVPANVEAGATFDVKWDGPNNPQDFITIVNRGEKEGIYGSYTYTKRSEKNKVAELQAPEIPGEYEVRYLTGNKRYTLASAPFAVGKVQASLDGPEEVMEGATFEVKWEGPDNLQDFITIVEAGTKEGEYGDYAYTKRKQGPRALRVVELSAPEQSGEFEIRYLTGQNKLTLAYQPIKIVPATAKLDASKTTTARSIFDVSWEGPGNNGDYVELILKGGEQREDLAYVRRGKVVQLQAPQTPGQYELRYLTAKKEKVLATREIEITPSKTPGSLSVVGDIGELQYSATKKLNVALILDASGSMLKTDVGERRINIAKKAVASFIKNTLGDGTPFSMRVFGHKEVDSCRTDLEIPFGPLQKSSALSTVSSIEAKNYAKTPIARSLELIEQDLKGSEGERVVVLVTDGEETCDGDPESAITRLVNAGFDTRVNIVGFAIDEFMLKETFRKWARVGKGKYFDAKNSEELEKSIKQAIDVPFEVLNDSDELIATGIVNGGPIELLPGTYNIKVLTNPEKSFNTVAVESERLKTVEVL